MISIYYPTDLFDETQRQDWFELLKSRERFERKGSELDRKIQSRIKWVSNPQEAKLWLIPMDWKFYLRKGLMKQALDFCALAARNNKNVWSFNGSDYGLEIKTSSNVSIYRLSYTRSTQKSNDRIMPFFLSDPVENVLKSDKPEILFPERETKKPVIGFCGMAPSGLKIYLREWMLAGLQNLKSTFGKIKMMYQPYLSTSNLRHKALQVFVKSDSFNTDFIIHTKHRAGAKTTEERKKSTGDYYANMLRSHLVLCVRGAGNFSVRFYETLAMGRIPVFIDADSPLPDISPKNWNDYIIWVDSKDIKRAPEIAKEWLDKRNISEQQRKNRQLWADMLRVDSFWCKQFNELKKENE